jgi:D-sedoheptulose 7-phosphate isomerase
MYSVSSYFQDLDSVKNAELIKNWDLALNVLVEAWRKKSKVLVAGNGGNFLNSLHFATDWNKSLKMLSAHALETVVAGENIGLNSAIENDFSHEDSIVNYAKFSNINFDIFVLLSASGTSKNILRASKFAREQGITTIGLLGGTTHKNDRLFNYPVLVQSDDIQIVEDFHAKFGHTLVTAVLSQI